MCWQHESHSQPPYEGLITLQFQTETDYQIEEH